MFTSFWPDLTCPLINDLHESTQFQDQSIKRLITTITYSWTTWNQKLCHVSCWSTCIYQVQGKCSGAVACTEFFWMLKQTEVWCTIVDKLSKMVDLFTLWHKIYLPTLLLFFWNKSSDTQLEFSFHNINFLPHERITPIMYGIRILEKGCGKQSKFVIPRQNFVWNDKCLAMNAHGDNAVELNIGCLLANSANFAAQFGKCNQWTGWNFTHLIKQV